MACTTVRCLATTSLGRPEWSSLFLVRILCNYIHPDAITTMKWIIFWLKCLCLKFLYCNKSCVVLKKTEYYVPQCLHLHPCVGSPAQWRQARRPSCPVMTVTPHLLPNTGGTKMAPFCPLTPARFLASKTPPTGWTQRLATWSAAIPHLTQSLLWQLWPSWPLEIIQIFWIYPVCLLRSFLLQPRWTQRSTTVRLSTVPVLLSAVKLRKWKSVSAVHLSLSWFFFPCQKWSD